MSAHSDPRDRVRVAVRVDVPPADAFRVFTEEIDAWWRRGLRYRVGRDASVLRLEPGVGGRLIESFGAGAEARTVVTGRVTRWEPPRLLMFEWRAVNFAPHERTQVEVLFEPSAQGTLVTVTHSGWAALRSDHPARHGLEPGAFLRMLGLWWGDLADSLRQHAARPSA